MRYYEIVDNVIGEADDPALNAYIRGFRSLVAGRRQTREALGLVGRALEIGVETGSPAGIGRVRCFRPVLDRWNGTRAVTVLDEQLADAV